MSWIHNQVLLPLMEPERHRGLGRRLQAIEHFDRLSRDQQRGEQQRRVRAILEHAYKTCPYYRGTFDELGFRATDWHSGEPIPCPELSRDLLRANADDLRSRSFSEEQLQKALTGGTTSTPVPLWRDLDGLRNKTAMQYRLNRQAGYDQGEPVLFVWGAERDIQLNPNWKWRFYEEVLLRRKTVGAGQITEKALQKFVATLNDQKPRILYGYSATTTRFVEYLRATTREYHKPERVIVTAEPLSPEDRKILEDAFECPVTEHYGSRDIGMVAAQCDEGKRYHFHPMSCYVELVHTGESSDGPVYKLVVTDLLNYGMPLIRYDTGDCVSFDKNPCACGSWYPSVTAILGRSGDNFVLPDGSLIPGIAVNTMLYKSTGSFRYVRQIQLVQKTITQMHMRYSAESGDPLAIQQELAAFRKQVEQTFEVPLQWTAERVPEILRERSGKIRLCISEVTPAAQRAG